MTAEKPQICAVDELGRCTAVLIPMETEKQAARRKSANQPSYDEQVSILKLLEGATPPEECGTNIPIAPARGSMISFVPTEARITDTGGIAVVKTGHVEAEGTPEVRRLRAARVADVWDRMDRTARVAHRKMCKEAEAKNEDPPAFKPPFNASQVAMARYYAALVERVNSSGMGCVSLETTGKSGSGGGDHDAARLRDVGTLRMLERRIGDGVAKSKKRPSQTQGRQIAILTRDLVYDVAVRDRSLTDVLNAGGWAKTGANQKPLKLALRAALDKMMGYDLKEAQ